MKPQPRTCIDFPPPSTTIRSLSNVNSQNLNQQEKAQYQSHWPHTGGPLTMSIDAQLDAALYVSRVTAPPVEAYPPPAQRLCEGAFTDR